MPREAPKPPIGIMPIQIWRMECDVQRLKALSAAIFRYADAGQPIPIEWVVELSALVEQVFSKDEERGPDAA